MHGYIASLTPVGEARTVALSAMMPVSDAFAAQLDGMVGVAADERTREGRGGRRPAAAGPLFRAQGMVHLSPELVRAEPTAGERVIAEWAVLCGSRTLATPRIDENLAETRVASVPAPNSDAHGSTGDFSGRCWEPFMRYLSRSPSEKREATYGHDPMPVPLQFPPIFEPDPDDEEEEVEEEDENGGGGIRGAKNRMSRWTDDDDAKYGGDGGGGGGGGGDGDDEDESLRRTLEVTVLANAFSASSMHAAIAAQAEGLRRCSRVQTLRDQFDKHGLQQDDWTEAVHALENMAEAYRYD
jgi:hypothetical protein